MRPMWGRCEADARRSLWNSNNKIVVGVVVEINNITVVAVVVVELNNIIVVVVVES